MVIYSFDFIIIMQKKIYNNFYEESHGDRWLELDWGEKSFPLKAGVQQQRLINPFETGKKLKN